MKYRIFFQNHDFVDVELENYISKDENENRAIILAQAEQIKKNRSYINVTKVTVTEDIVKTVNFSVGEGWLNIYTNCKNNAQGGGIYTTQQIAKDISKNHCKGSIFIIWRDLFK